MNPFLFSLIALCLAQGAVAQYGYQQRKMAPSPQTYGAAPASSYGQQQQASSSSYGAQSYEAPASSSYEARSAPVAAASYGKQSTASYSRPQSSSSYGQSASSGYGQQQPASSYSQQSSYGQQQQSYAKPAAKYEPEPYYPPMPFSWGYDLSDGYGAAQYHKETGDEYGKRVGSYGYTDAYGVYRQVDYVADENGFRATVKSNEPGLQKGQESPASTEFLVYEPPSNYYAGNTNSYSAAPAAAPAYGKQSSGYGSAQSSQSYSAGSAASSSYAPAQQSYSAPQQSYRPAPSSSYKSAGASSGYQQASAGGQYAAASSSAPTYQKAGAQAAKDY